jgi:hypothetical protein
MNSEFSMQFFNKPNSIVMKRNILFSLIIVSLAACLKTTHETKTEEEPAETNVSTEITPCGCWIACTNQSNNMLEAYDPAVYDWNTAAAKKWSFIPTTERGYSATAEIPLWYGPADLKLRNSTVFAGTSQVIVTVGGRLATIAAYPSGNKIWTMGYSAGPPAVALHSAELLPNGNIALASADRNWIRVYSSSQPVPNHGNFAEYPLTSAHATLWDPSINRLWVLGRLPNATVDIITALIVGGTDLNPTLTEDLSRRDTLPPGYFWGHDLYPYYYNNNKLWVTCNQGVFVYTKSTRTFTAAPGESNSTFVKAIGNQPSGQIVETKPSSGGCTANGWSTSTVTFYDGSTGALHASRTVTGACFYKGRVFSPDYQ